MKEREGDGSRNTAPRINGHWLTGSLMSYLRAPLEFYSECAQEYGDIAFGRFANVPICVLSHPRYVEQLLVQEVPNLEQSRFLRNPLKRLLGEGLLIAGKASHTRQRPLVEKTVRGEIAAAWAEEVVGTAERFVASWTKGEPRDLYPAMLRMVSEVLAGVAFGASPHAAEISAAVNRGVDLTTDRLQQFPPIPDFVPTRENLEVRKALREMDRALSAAMREARRVPGTRSGLLSELVTARGKGCASLSDSEIRDQIVMIHVAVRQNLAAALTWTFYLLSQSNESYANVLREVESVAGSGRPGLEEEERLVYCDRVVKESLRLYPPVWQVLRHAVRETQIGGHKIRAGTQVLMSQWVLQRDVRFFEEGEKFMPERWESPREEWRLSYFPFGAGPRACFGERLSFLTVKLVLAVLTRKFRLHLVPGQEVKPLPVFALRPNGRVLMEARAKVGRLD